MLRAYAALRAQLVTEKDGDEEQVSGTGQVGSTGNYSCTDYSWSTCFKDTDGTRINTIKEVDFLPSFQPVVCQSHLLVHFCTRLWICNPLPRNILEKAIELLITSVSCLIWCVWLLPSKREKAESSWTEDISYFFSLEKSYCDELLYGSTWLSYSTQFLIKR